MSSFEIQTMLGLVAGAGRGAWTGAGTWPAVLPVTVRAATRMGRYANLMMRWRDSTPAEAGPKLSSTPRPRAYTLPGSYPFRQSRVKEEL
jgi:hypothetical protein